LSLNQNHLNHHSNTTMSPFPSINFLWCH
jgi:hypothetical protein